MFALCVSVGSGYETDSVGPPPPLPDIRTDGPFDPWPPTSPNPAPSPPTDPIVGPVGVPTLVPPTLGPPVGVPPSRKPPVQPGPDTAAPLLTVTKGGVPSTVDLSAEGALDWVHWGLRDATSVNRKSTGANTIADQGGSGLRRRYDTNPQRFSWRDGAPDGAVLNTPAGLYVCGAGGAFQVSVPAGPQARTLRLYAGVWQASGRLEASLSGTGLTRTESLTDRSSVTFTAIFTITFRAPSGGRLLVRWAATETFGEGCGNVDIQAATLR